MPLVLTPEKDAYVRKDQAAIGLVNEVKREDLTKSSDQGGKNEEESDKDGDPTPPPKKPKTIIAVEPLLDTQKARQVLMPLRVEVESQIVSWLNKQRDVPTPFLNDALKAYFNEVRQFNAAQAKLSKIRNHRINTKKHENKAQQEAEFTETKVAIA